MKNTHDADEVVQSVASPSDEVELPFPSRLVVPAELCLMVQLSRRPNGAADFAGLLQEAVPLRLNALVWTEPFGPDARSVIVVRRHEFEQFLANAQPENGVRLPAVTEEGEWPIGPASRPAPNIWLTYIIVAGSLVTILAAMSLASTGEPAVRNVTTEKVRTTSALLPDFPGLSATVLSYAGRSVQNGILTGITRTADGALELVYTATDPDELRGELAGNTTLAQFQPVSQSRAEEGMEGYRVSLRADPQADGPLLAGNPIAAPNAAAAASRAEQVLLALGRGKDIEMSLSRADTSRSGVLRHSLELSGPQQNVLSYVDDLESGNPPMRLSDWALSPQIKSRGPAEILLQGTLLVPWEEGL
ncbi:hypothetical protein G7A66_05045 [Altererythrobacter sp. SALINAS58]|uniref:hypothetical protein n=1 Tax=Alteripontixanthobacter muriae TaxID=2705546 RepID=UPI0015764624|nr:hypothetical protein [Alteripontixanthobacter muriae]NTZ42462.1 hypothetical protein [Alteripontixanthobacter muriae]